MAEREFINADLDSEEDRSRRPSAVAIASLSAAQAARRRWQSLDKEASPGSLFARSETRRTRREGSAELTDKAKRISQMFQKNTLRDELTRVAASDPSLTELDLSGSTRFLSTAVFSTLSRYCESCSGRTWSVRSS